MKLQEGINDDHDSEPIVRPEKADAVLAALMDAGFPAVTKMDVYGRGKQRGIRIGDVHYDEIPKELLMMVVKEADKQFVVKTIMTAGEDRREGRLRRRQNLPLAGGRGLHRQLRGEGIMSAGPERKRP